MIVEAIRAAGFAPGEQIAIALDPAASTFCAAGGYGLRKWGGGRTICQLIDLYSQWSDRYPIVSIEDGFGENDWDGFRALTAKLGDRI